MKTPHNLRVKRAYAMYEVLSDLAQGGDGTDIDLNQFCDELLKHHRPLFSRLGALRFFYETMVARDDFITVRRLRLSQASRASASDKVH